ncbi:hypothetical protein C1646_769163 [Rhizophagus diaphanus]|nr:hypothetical protein C1646_769163 [Rhizophagus diaphanus] [Rhizophagus sp. MUCL 43196]
MSNSDFSTNIEVLSNQDIKEGVTFKDYTTFETYIKSYAQNHGFIIRLDRAKFELNKEIRWVRYSMLTKWKFNKAKNEKNENITSNNTNNNSRNRASQCCNCPFIVRGIKSKNNGLWTIVKINLTHNHGFIPLQINKTKNF